MRKWTNVEDGLPKGIPDKKGYLCECCINDNVESPFYMVLNYYPGEDAHFQHESYMGLKVMRWMPIPVEDNDGWISVKDEMPEEMKKILAFNRRGKGKAWDMDFCWWNGSAFDRCSKRPYHNVTHWMPVPGLPKEENDEK